MLRIKLKPFGKKNDQSYRIVVVEGKSKLTGSPVAELGQYHPLSGQVKIDQAEAKKWLAKGATPTDRIRKLLTK